MSLLKAEILSLNPPLYWTCEDAAGATSLVNRGTVGAGGNAVKVSNPNTGFISLTADGGETSAFQGGVTVNEGWNAGAQGSVIIGAADSFTAFAVVQAFAPPPRTTIIVSEGLSGHFGGWYLAIDSLGFSHWTISDVSSHVLDLVVPPVIADGVPHAVALVRDTSTHQFLGYLDGQLMVAFPDPTTGTGVTFAGSVVRVANWDQQTFGFIGAYGHVFVIRAVVAGLEQVVLANKLWAGNPPAFATSVSAFTKAALTAQAALLDKIYAAVHKVY